MISSYMISYDHSQLGLLDVGISPPPMLRPAKNPWMLPYVPNVPTLLKPCVLNWRSWRPNEAQRAVKPSESQGRKSMLHWKIHQRIPKPPRWRRRRMWRKRLRKIHQSINARLRMRTAIRCCFLIRPLPWKLPSMAPNPQKWSQRMKSLSGRKWSARPKEAALESCQPPTLGLVPLPLTCCCEQQPRPRLHDKLPGKSLKKKLQCLSYPPRGPCDVSSCNCVRKVASCERKLFWFFCECAPAQ